MGFIREGNDFSIATFNVRGLSSEEKRAALCRDLKNYRIQICVLQETKTTESVDKTENGYRIILLPPACRHYGLGFAVAKELATSVEKVWSLSDRVAGITLKNSSCRFSILNVYAPTLARCANDSGELDDFYSTLSSAVNKEQSSSILFIAGDFNAKVGVRGRDESCIGSHGRGQRNISGEALVQFCELNDMFLSNTAFQHSARHKTTWTGQRLDKSTGKVVKIYNQIDYILCKRAENRLLMDARSYGGTTVNSDHKLVVARLKLPRLFGIWGKNKTPSRKANEKIAVHQLASRPDLQKRLSETVEKSPGPDAQKEDPTPRFGD